MNVVLTYPVEIAMRTLGVDDQRKVQAWFDCLKNWESDPFAREHSKKLPSTANIYVLMASDGYRIFFKLEDDRIEIEDIATREAIMKFAHLGNGQ